MTTLAAITVNRSREEIERLWRDPDRRPPFHLAFSALTRYPLGIVKLIPFQAHLAIDPIGALSLAATPLVTGQFRHGRRGWVPHVA
jgi:hypothetical protein